jgi:hypothetical protein
MKTTSNSADLIRDALLSPSGGIVGLVESLLTICKTHGLQLNWQAERCRVCSINGESVELIDVPLRKSVFRAVLARVAVLCNECEPNSISPYGGHGRLRAIGDSATEFGVIFVNTADEQYLEVGPA